MQWIWSIVSIAIFFFDIAFLGFFEHIIFFFYPFSKNIAFYSEIFNWVFLTREVEKIFVFVFIKGKYLAKNCQGSCLICISCH